MVSSTPEAPLSPAIDGHKKEQTPLNFRLVFGPLPETSSRFILEEYNRETSSQIPYPEFIHWTRNSPEGPALHAILEDQSGQIVGHQCLLPLTARFDGVESVAAKSEYTFIHEAHRASKISGHEKSPLPTHMIACRLLLEQGEAMGWKPMLISTLPFLYRWARTVGCEVLEIPLVECLFVLKPWKAATETLNLVPWQRVGLGITGMLQSLEWRLAPLLAGQRRPLQRIAIDQESPEQRRMDAGLPYFQDSASLRWRYPNDQYEKFAVEADPRDYLILKSGSLDGYLRVCQWSLSTNELSPQFLCNLVRHAEEKKALGLRWAVYGSGEEARKMVSKMHRLGFLCVKRIRTLLVRSNDRRFLSAGNWNLNDAMFSFHH